MNNTEEFYKFYKNKMNSLNFEPNITHKKDESLGNVFKDI